jgi:hypothetical protein
MLKAVAPAQLRATIERIDTSTGNVQRRSFLRTVAASALTATVSSAVACGDEDVGPPAPAGIRPDQMVPDQGSDLDTSRGIRPDLPDGSVDSGDGRVDSGDGPTDGSSDAVAPGDMPQSFGIRPDAWED